MSYAASIVIPLLRQVDAWLEQCVRSALAQTVPTEVVVVRSQLTPPSNIAVLERLQGQYEGLTVCCEKKRGSFPNAINTGIDRARAARVGLVLSDDWLDEAAVEHCLKEAADIVSTGSIVYFPDGTVNEYACNIPSLSRYQSLATLEAKANYLTHFFLFHKNVLSRTRLDEGLGNYPGIDDYDLIWSLLEGGATVALVEKPLYHYRDHDCERLTLTDPKLQAQNLKKILRKHKVSEHEARDIISRHVRWYGKPIYKSRKE